MLLEQKEKDVLRGKGQGKAIWPFSISACDDPGDGDEDGDEGDDNGHDSESSH